MRLRVDAYRFIYNCAGGAAPNWLYTRMRIRATNCNGLERHMMDLAVYKYVCDIDAGFGRIVYTACIDEFGAFSIPEEIVAAVRLAISDAL